MHRKLTRYAVLTVLAGFTLCAAASADAAEVKKKENGTAPASKTRSKKVQVVAPIPRRPQVALIEVLGPADSLSDLVASETGIYARKSADSADGRATDQIVKWQNTPGKTGWLNFPVPASSTTFAPAQLRHDTGINIYWAGSDSATGSPVYLDLGHVEKDDIRIKKIVTGGGNMGRRWVITDSEVRLKATGGSRDRRASEVFEEKGTHDGLGHVAVADVKDGSLYAAAGNLLYRFSILGEKKHWELPHRINTLVSAMNSIWIGSGSEIYRLEGGKLSLFANVPNVLGISAPIFCISNLDIFAANGTVYRGVESGPAPTPKPFVAVQEHLLAQDKFLGVAMAKAGMIAAGIYCADNNSQDLYTMASNLAQPGTMSLIRMVPLQ